MSLIFSETFWIPFLLVMMISWCLLSVCRKGIIFWKVRSGDTESSSRVRPKKKGRWMVGKDKEQEEGRKGDWEGKTGKHSYKM